MNRIIAALTLIVMTATVNLYAEVRIPKFIPLYDEKKSLDEVSTIFISPEDHYLEMHVRAIDGHRFNIEKKEYYSDIDKYLVLPGTHDIVVGYSYITPAKKHEDRKKIYDELTTTITTKPNHLYELRQNHRRYVSDPKEIRVDEYKPGEKYFVVYRRNVIDIKEQIEKLNTKDDSKKISDQYNQLAITYRKLKEHKNAVEAYENAVKFNPEKSALYYAMTIPSLIEIKEYSKAMQTIEKMKKYEKREWITDGLYGEVYGDMGQYDKAISYFTKAVDNAPLMNKEGLRERLAFFYRKAGMSEKYQITLRAISEDRDKKDKLYIEITKEVRGLAKVNKESSAEDKKKHEEAFKKILEKYNITEDKLFEIMTVTMENHEKEFAEQYKK